MSRSHGNDTGEKGPLESVDMFVVAEEKEKELADLRSPTSDRSRSPSVRSREDSNAQNVSDESWDDGEPKLPMSKARCIALVATVTGAAFLNVCFRLQGLRGNFRRSSAPPPLLVSCQNLLLTKRLDPVHAIGCHHSTEHWERA